VSQENTVDLGEFQVGEHASRRELPHAQFPGPDRVIELLDISYLDLSRIGFCRHRKVTR
jgi:hypothetical protein